MVIDGSRPIAEVARELAHPSLRLLLAAALGYTTTHWEICKPHGSKGRSPRLA